MRAALWFAQRLDTDDRLEPVASVRVELFGSLGATGHGHDSVKAVVLGLLGHTPDGVDPAAADPQVEDTAVRYPSTTGAELLARTRATCLPISAIMLANESSWRTEDQARAAGLRHLWSVMRGCVAAGCHAGGVLPGGLKVRRRAARLHRQLEHNPGLTCDPVGGLVQIPLHRTQRGGLGDGRHHGRWTGRSRRCARPGRT